MKILSVLNHLTPKILDVASVILFFSSTLLIPFYFFKATHLQLSHSIMIISALIIIFIKIEDAWILFKNNIYLPAFLGLITLTNSIYLWQLHNIEFFLNTLHWLFNSIIFFSFLLLFNNKRFYGVLKWMILSIFFLITITYFLGFGTYTFWPRYDFYFNGPNQLGFFTLCMLLSFFVINRSLFNLQFFIAYSLAFFIFFSTGGRSIYIALPPLILIFSFFSRKQMGKLIYILAIPMVIFITFSFFKLPLNAGISDNQQNINFSPGIIKNTTDRFDILLEPSNLEFKKQLSVRAGEQMKGNFNFFLYGAGQGSFQRFSRESGEAYEVHSSLGAILFYYGILGFFLFLNFVYQSFLVKKNIIFLLPLIFYSSFTYGFRAPYFWICLALLSLMPPITNNYSDSSST